MGPDRVWTVRVRAAWYAHIISDHRTSQSFTCWYFPPSNKHFRSNENKLSTLFRYKKIKFLFFYINFRFNTKCFLYKNNSYKNNQKQIFDTNIRHRQQYYKQHKIPILYCKKKGNGKKIYIKIL